LPAALRQPARLTALTILVSWLTAFSKYDPTSATIMLDKHTQRPRGFGFVWFKDKLGMEDAIRDMHNKELEGRVISVTKAVPMDQTKPGTPAASLGGGVGARKEGFREPRRDRGGYGGGGGYNRGYDRGGGGYDKGYDRGYGSSGYGGGYDRGYGGGYDRGYGGGYGGAYGGGYGGGYGATYGRDYGRDPYDYGGGGGYGGGYDRYDGYSGYDDRGAEGPPRRGGYAAARAGPYDRPADRRAPDPRR